MTRRHEDVLTDYVRERLDRLVAASTGPGAPEEAALRTVVRPRPVLHHARETADDGLPDWWRRQPGTAEPDEESEPQRASLPPEPSGSGGAESVSHWVRTRFTRQHLLVVGVVLALGVLVAAFALTRARAVPIAPPVPVAAASPLGQPVPSLPPASSPSPEPIWVHVVGEVMSPGVHRLAMGARVADAIDAASGLTRDARPGELNLALVLADGQQVVIGGPQRTSEVRSGGESGGAAGSAAPGSPGGAPAGKLNLNTATAAQLDTLPGVGPVTAEKVVAWRTQHGKFTRIEELQEVPGIGPKTYAEIAPHVTV